MSPMGIAAICTAGYRTGLAYPVPCFVDSGDLTGAKRGRTRLSPAVPPNKGPIVVLPLDEQ